MLNVAHAGHRRLNQAVYTVLVSTKLVSHLMLDIVSMKRHIFFYNIYSVTTNILFSHFNGETFVMKKNAALHPMRSSIISLSDIFQIICHGMEPMHKSFFRAVAKMLQAINCAYLIGQLLCSSKSSLSLKDLFSIIVIS
jgi:hypothetical protein